MERRQGQPESVLGHDLGVHPSGDRHVNAELVGGIEVDLVVADPGSGDQAQRGEGREELASIRLWPGHHGDAASEQRRERRRIR